MPILKSFEEEFISREKGGRLTPDYDRLSLVNIPSTIASCLGVKQTRPVLPKEILEGQLDGVERVVLLLLDGFGYDQFLRRISLDFFSNLLRKGVVSPLTTVFPSTTAAAVTSINTGLTPQEHGLPEWYTYFREIEMALMTLPFRPMDPRDNRRFYDSGASPNMLFRGDTIYETLRREGIKSFTLTKSKLIDGAYSKVSHGGSTMVGYHGAPDMAVRLRKLLEDESGPAYFHVYYDEIDFMGHLYGPGTEEHASVISALSHILQKEFLEKLDPRAAKRTALMLVADHGQVGVKPEAAHYLERDGELFGSFERNSYGMPIPPTGSPRDVILHIEPRRLFEVEAALKEILAGIADVILSGEALKEGLFGRGRPRPEFLDRIGNLIILPKGNSMVWYRDFKGTEVKLRGLHGGLAHDEMVVPFAVARLSDLILQPNSSSG